MPQHPSPTTVRVLETSSTAWLTTLRPDGSPHVTPVWFVWQDGRFWLGSARRNVKVRNMLADPRVSLAVDGSTATPVVVQGSATVRAPGPQDATVVQSFAARFDGWDLTDSSVDGERVLVEVAVDRWFLDGTA